MRALFIHGSKGEEGDKAEWRNGQWIARGHFAEGAIVGGNANAFFFNWQNPHANKIIPTRALLLITTAGGVAAGELDLGIAAGSGVHSDNLIDGADANPGAVPIVYDNIDDQGVNGKSKGVVDENGGANDWITGQILVQNEVALAGKVYIEYIEVLA